MREITFEQEKTIIVEPAKTKTTNTVSLKYVKDDGVKVIAFIDFERDTKEYVLWDSESIPTYSTCGANADGQWTDDDVDARLNELL